MDMQLCVPCLFGLEGLVADELKRMHMREVAAENGRVSFRGGPEDLARANIRLATGERVLIRVGQFPADSFDALFTGTTSLPWAEYLPRDCAFPVKGHCLSSMLHSVPDCQRIIKKAVVESLKRACKTDLLPETGPVYQIQFSILKDAATLYLDTTGPGLYKRGYRIQASAAPLRETLAAAMVRLSRYRGRDAFSDPFCGSGTIPIEAALAARNRAPGLRRKFAAEAWHFPQKLWQDARAAAAADEYAGSYEILASDIDPSCIEIARQNARRAGVEQDIRFCVSDAAAFKWERDKGVLVTNPPYGERLMDLRQAEALYRAFGARVRTHAGWKLYILSPHEGFESLFGMPADKKRKLYNGMIRCNLYQYLDGPGR